MKLLYAVASLCGAFLLLLILLPFVAFLLVLNWLAVLRRRTPDLSLLAPVRPLASIVVPTWNGRELLERCLPALLAAVESTGGAHEIIVVDNGSEDGSTELVERDFPRVNLLRLEGNLGFGGGCNAGIEAARNDVVVLLNNDMVVEADFLAPLLRPFVDPRTFAVTAQIDLWQPGEVREETGLTRGEVTWGQLWVAHDAPPPDTRAPRPVFYAGGGSSAFDRRKLRALGGFDDLFHPFYGEDTDLSFRAWKRGWQVLYQPQSRVHHKHRGTIGARFSEEFIRRVVQRNHLLFVWKNVSSWQLLLPMVVGLPLRCARDVMSGRWSWWALADAAARVPALVARVWRERPLETVGDRAALCQSSDALAWLDRFTLSRSVQRQAPLNILFLCPYFPYPPAHGGAVRMYNVIRRLGARHRIHLLSFIDREEERAGVPEMERYCSSVRTFLRRPRLSDHNPFGPDPLCLTEFESAAMRRAIRETLVEQSIDVIQVDYTQMAHYLYASPHWLTVLTEHDLSFLSAWRLFRNQPWSLAKGRDFVGYLKMLDYELDVCRRYDLVLTVTPREADELKSYAPGVRVSAAAPTGVDARYLAATADPTLPELPTSLLFVGYFPHRPNVDAILYFARDVYPLIKAEAPEARLTIVGKEPPAEVAALSEDSSITVSGFVEDIRACYQRHTVFVAPIRYGAGVRVKIIEAMAAGAPVVATSLGVEGIVCQPGDDLLVADSPADFARSVVRLLRDAKLRCRIATNGRRVALEHYDFDAIVRNLEQLYFDELERKRGVMANSTGEPETAHGSSERSLSADMLARGGR